MRRVVPRLVLERFATWESHFDDVETRGARLLDAIASSGGALSLSEDCERPEEVVPAAIRHRLRVQTAFDALAGVGADWSGRPVTLSDPSERPRIDEFAAALEREKESLEALGWTLDDVLKVLILPVADRGILVDALHELSSSDDSEAAPAARRASNGGTSRSAS